ncbi:MAG: methionyl-tRNA formyltransferase [Candidatus Hodarchaeales archaeon]|jgi:folate-dependent phosphoribosylglycinamide formyltransferase PurN
MDNQYDNHLRILLLTRTGRPSGEKVLSALLSAKKNCVGVIAEKRTSLLFKKGQLSFIRDSFKTHGPIFVFGRIFELLKARFRKNRASLKELCRRCGLPFYIVENHNSKRAFDILKSLQPDVLITANTRIIQKHVIKLPLKAAINIHTSKLPHYAGLDSIFWALYHGEKEIGVSIHHLEPGLDTGDIVLQETIPVMPADNLETLTEKANHLGAQLTVKTVGKFEKGDFKGFPQDREQRSYFSWPTPAKRKELRKIMHQRANGNCIE